jgi:uncharacterized membrane protein
MQRKWNLILLVSMVFFLFGLPKAVLAQGEQPPSDAPSLTLFTSYPSQVIGTAETATFTLNLTTTNTPKTLQLSMKEMPDGWTATFRGGGQIVQAVYVEPDTQASVELLLEPPTDLQSGSYHFVVSGVDGATEVDLPLDLTVKEKLPPSLSLTVNLPTLKGTPSTTFRYNATLKNEGDEDLSVNLLADAPTNFQVNFNLSGQDVTNIPLTPNQSQQLSIEVQPVGDVPAGSYPITVQAQGAEAQASLTLTAEVTGQSKLSVTAPDGRLSGQAYAGQSTPLKITLQNTGSAAAVGIELSASPPSGWSVDFTPQQIAEIPAGQQVEVTANIQPSDQAVAGDYMVTVNAKPAEGASQSADFRITVLTSTLWGIVGIALVAIALGVVAIAVVRFGRR